MNFLPFVQGMGLGMSMVIPIGAQNSYVLSRAIKRNYHYTTAAICLVLDVLLMSFGVYAGSQLITLNSLIFTLLTWSGIIFLLIYGGYSFRACWQGINQQQSQPIAKHQSLKVVVITTLALTLLNPHVYLDTIVIVGSVSSQFAEQEKLAFTLGILCTSALWFALLAKGGAKFSATLSQVKVRRVIDAVIGCVMWFIALSLYLNYQATH